MKRKRGLYLTDSSDPTFGRKAWSTRYDAIDQVMSRPIHKGMSVAPPWARRHHPRLFLFAILKGQQ